MHNVAVASESLRKYGLERTWDRPLAEGDAIRYTMFNADEEPFGFDNFYLTPEDTHGGVRASGGSAASGGST